MAKKNHMKFLPKAGSTLAVAVAMTVALSTQVNATELEDVPNPDSGNPPVDQEDSNIQLNQNEMEPAEYNQAVEESNQETLQENQDISNDNQQTEQDNADAAEKNAADTEGTLEAPQLDLPDAPEMPNTEGLDAEDHNAAVDQYNKDVDDYNAAVDQYNKDVDDYNAEADAFEKADQERFEEEQEAYEEAEKQHQAAQDKLEQDLQQQEQNKDAFEDYQEEKDSYTDAGSDYQDVLEEYEQSLNRGEADADARTDYLQGKEAYDEARAAYLAALETYQNAVPDHDPGSAEYQQYLQDKAAYDDACAAYLEALERYNTQILPQYEQDSQEYQQYLQDKAAYDEAYAAYLEQLYNYNQDYQEKVDQSDREQQIVDDVNQYNQEVGQKNNELRQENEKLQSSLDVGVADNLEEVNEINKNVNVGSDVLQVLGTYETLQETQNTLQAAGEALATHSGREADLGSAEYAAYLKAVEDHNKAVDQFNLLVAAYNNAVNTYNAAVDTYNATKPDVPSNPTTSGGIQNGTGEGIDWGNVNMNNNTTVNHVDVKYEAAASKTVTEDESGNKTYSETVNRYEVTGVYADATVAAQEQQKKESDRQYSLSYDNDGSGPQGEQVQELLKSESYQEFGIDHDKLNNPYRYPDFVAPKLNPATGTVSFHVTLKDSEGVSHGIDVNLSANSVYADGSFYKAQYNAWGQESDFLNAFYTLNEKGEKQYLPVVMIKNENGVEEKYYDISGQSVFLISALTCDGMNNWGGKLNPNGVDLVLNMQTMIESHQSASAKKVGYLTYELEKYKAVDENNLSDPGQRLDAPVFDSQLPDAVEDPGQRPEAPTYDPGTWQQDAPKDPVKVQRLENVNTLDTLEKKLVILFEEPVTPPVTPAPEYQVQTLADHFEIQEEEDLQDGWEIEIPDEEVPLAAAPKTGDVSALWGAISGISAAAYLLLGKKRKA